MYTARQMPEVAASPAQDNKLPRAVVLVLGFATALALFGWLLFFAAYWHTHDIAVRGLFPAGPAYLDLTTYIGRFEVFRTRAFFEIADPALHRSRFAYPPAAALCYKLLYGSHHMKVVYILLSVIVWLGILAFSATAILRAGCSRLTTATITTSLLLLSYPAAFLFQRANIEIILWPLIAVGLVLFVDRRAHMAAICFGLAAAMKLYPVLLLGLFLKRARLPALLTGVFTATLVTIGTIAFTAPGFFITGARGYLQGITGFQNKYAGTLSAGATAFDHSLFSWVKLVALHYGQQPQRYTPVYYLVCAVAVCALFLLRVRHHAALNQLTFLLVLIVLVPPVSFEYTLVHLYLPTILLLQVMATSVNSHREHRRAALVALAALLSLLLPVDLLGPFSGYAGQFQVASLFAVLTAAVWHSWTEDLPLAHGNAALHKVERAALS